MTNSFKNQAAALAARHRALLSALLYIGRTGNGRVDWHARREVKDWILRLMQIDTLAAQIKSKSAQETLTAFAAVARKAEADKKPVPAKPEAVKQAEKLLAERERIKKHYGDLKDILNGLPAATTQAEFESLLHQAKSQSPDLLEEAMAAAGSVAIAAPGDILAARSAIGTMKDIWGGWVTLPDGRRF